MTDWRSQVHDTLLTFVAVAQLAGEPIGWDAIEVEYLRAPHRPPSRLPADKTAIFGFWGDGVWLKLGRAGPNSNARYTSQHYNPGSAPSTLAKTLADDPHMLTVAGFDPTAPGEWMKDVTHRVNVLLPASTHPELVLLLEAFLNLRLRPRYDR
jgi:hypothetical protein